MAKIKYQKGKPVSLTGEEDIITEYTPYYAVVINNTQGTIYVSKEHNIRETIGTNIVKAIPAGMADYIAAEHSIYDRFFALGNGSIEIIEADSVLDCLGKVVRYNASANKSLLKMPNMLINADFRINQRGKAEYSNLQNSEYSIDMWKSNISTKLVKQNADGVSVTTEHMYGGIWQQMESGYSRFGESYTASVFFNETPPADWYIDFQLVGYNENGEEWVYGRSTNIDTANMPAGLVQLPPIIVNQSGEYFLRLFICTKSAAESTINIGWAKIENGNFATPYYQTDPATELAKCQRYFQIRSTGEIAEADLRPTMRTTPTVTQLDNGYYAYSAEL